ncbi:MAG: IS21 family transposase, partial [Methanothrix sp.]
MIDVEEFLTLRDLFNKDLSISEIARQTGHSRVTVRKYLNSGRVRGTLKRANKQHNEYLLPKWTPCIC